MIAERSGNEPAFLPVYSLDGVPGSWRPTGPANALDPNPGRLKPFAVTSGTWFRPSLPGGFTSYDQLLRSRGYLGVHYQWDADGGLESGFDRRCRAWTSGFSRGGTSGEGRHSSA